MNCTCFGDMITEILNATKLIAGKLPSELCKPENPYFLYVVSVRRIWLLFLKK